MRSSRRRNKRNVERRRKAGTNSAQRFLRQGVSLAAALTLLAGCQGGSTPNAGRRAVSAPPASQAAAISPEERAAGEFIRYGQWLNLTERQRRKLCVTVAQSAKAAQSGTPAPGMAGLTRRQIFGALLQEIYSFQAQMERTRPTVPADCQVLDTLYTTAVTTDINAGRKVLRDMQDETMGATAGAQKGRVAVDAELESARRELARVHRLRKVDQETKIRPFSLCGTLAE